jgi:PAS domain S-box-containing protein
MDMKRKHAPNLATEAFRTLAENSPDVIDRFDREFHHLYVNAAGLRLIGLPAEKVVGKTIRETGLTEPYSSLWEERIRQVFATARPNDLIDSFPGATGTRHYESRCVPEVSPDGWVQTVLVISRDVTERKRAEELLEQRVAARTTELKRRSRQLAELAAELTLAEHRERRRLVDILHDHLQQLLVAARMEADSLPMPSKQSDRKGLHQLRAILVEAFQAARGIMQELVPPIPLHHHLSDAFLWLVQNMKDRHQLEVEARIGKGLDDVPEAESVLLFTAARELLLNIVKHAGTLRARLDLRGDAGTVILEIRDEGRSFDPASLRADIRHGYGLFSIQERAELLGGQLALEARPGRGVRATLTLPVVSVPPRPRPGDAPSRKHRKSGIATAGRKGISVDV